MIGNRKGWRLPTKEELSALLILPGAGSALPDGHPFENVKAIVSRYWSSTAYEGDSSRAWVVGFPYCRVEDDVKDFGSYVWPVLGGN